MSKHTAGEWQTGRTDLQSYLGDGTPVVYVYRGAGDPHRIPVVGERCWPDALLIAAAPAMRRELEELERLLKWLPSPPSPDLCNELGRAQQRIRALLAKIEIP